MTFKSFQMEVVWYFDFLTPLMTTTLQVKPKVAVKIAGKKPAAPAATSPSILLTIRLHAPDRNSGLALWHAYTGLKQWLLTEISEGTPLHPKVRKTKQNIKKFVFTFEVLQYEPEFLEDSHCGYETRNRFLGEVIERIRSKMLRILTPMAV